MQGPIRHNHNRGLFEYWRRRTGARRAPSRADIEPADIHAWLSETFILHHEQPIPAHFRLAGSRICTMVNRELKGENFADLWQSVDADTLAAALRIMREDASCCVVRWKGYTARDNNIAGEMLLLPLTMGGPDIVRVLGTMATFDTPYWFGTDPVTALSLKAISMVEPNGREPARQPDELVVASGPHIPGARRVAHLTVVEGGRDAQ